MVRDRLQSGRAIKEGHRGHCPVGRLLVAQGAEHEGDIADVVEPRPGAVFPCEGIERQCKAKRRVVLRVKEG